MNRKSLAFLIRALSIALAIVTIAPALPSGNPDIANRSGQTSASQPSSAPIIVAQGRCFNGHCY